MKISVGNVEPIGVRTVVSFGGAVEKEANTKKDANLESISALMMMLTKKTKKRKSNKQKKIFKKQNANAVSSTVT